MFLFLYLVLLSCLKIILAALTIRKDHTPAVLRQLAKAGSGTRVNALSGISRKEAALNPPH